MPVLCREWLKLYMLACIHRSLGSEDSDEDEQEDGEGPNGDDTEGSEGDNDGTGHTASRRGHGVGVAHDGSGSLRLRNAKPGARAAGMRCEEARTRKGADREYLGKGFGEEYDGICSKLGIELLIFQTNVSC